MLKCPLETGMLKKLNLAFSLIEKVRLGQTLEKLAVAVVAIKSLLFFYNNIL